VQVRVSTRHGHLSEASQAKISAKASKLLRIFDRLTEIVVVVDLEDEQRPHVEIQAAAEHKHDFVASEKANELMTAVDSVVHKLETQLRRYKDKVVDKHRDRDAKRMEPEVNEEADGADDE